MQLPIPPELSDQIIDHLDQDKLTLASCSLVSRSWHNRSRYRLFHSILIRESSRLEAFLAYLPSASIRTYVRNVTLGDPRKEVDFRKMSIGPTSLALLSELLPQLSNLFLLHMTWDSDEHINPPSQNCKSASSPCEYLDHLTLCGVMNAKGKPLATYEIVSVLRLFATIDRIQVASCQIAFDEPTEDTMVAEDAATLPEISTLWLAYSPANTRLLHLFRNSGLAKSLEAVDVHASQWSTVLALGALIREIGPNLTYLAVCYKIVAPNSGETVDEFRHALSVSSCSSLSRFHVSVLLRPGSPVVSLWQWDAMIALLQDVPAELITHIELSFIVENYPNPDDAVIQLTQFNWKRLERLLPRFRKLEGIVITRSEVETPSLVGNKIWTVAAQRLSSLTKKKIPLSGRHYIWKAEKS